MLLLRYGLLAGEQHGRPMGAGDTGLWIIEDGYPGPKWRPSDMEAAN